MDKHRYAKIRELFLEAEELPSDQQAAYIDSNCDGDEELAAEVRSLLSEHDANSARLEGERQIDVMGSLSSRQGADERVRNLESSGAGSRGQRDEGGASSANATLVGAQQTHATPRHGKTQRQPPSASEMPPPKTVLWAKQSKQARRFNSSWFLAAAILPTVLVGWLTYRTVDNMVRTNVRNNLAGLADGLALSTNRFLQDQAELVQSWSRQKQIRDAVLGLEKIGRTDDPLDALKEAPQSDVIMAQLQYLSGRPDIKFVVWDRTGTTLASWLPDRADVGNPIVEDQANGLARVFRDETILFGPARLLKNTEGFVPETDLPVMAPIVPVRDDKDRVVAAMLVRGFGMFSAFDRVFADTAASASKDVYAIDAEGLMVTNGSGASQAAESNRLQLPTEEAATRLRVAAPDSPLSSKSSTADDDDQDRLVLPLTYSAARVVRAKNGETIEAYRNYVGDDVVGAWRWLERWNVGIIVEESSREAFAATRVVRSGFLSLGGLLAITAITAAGRIARRSAKRQALLHPLSRYEILGELGSGGMGVVYKARHRQLGRDTALKVLRGDRRHPDDQARFDREAKLAATLTSPHCVRIYDYGSSVDGESYCVMEYLRGLTLHEVVVRSGHQSFGRSLFILRQICDAIGEAHSRGLMHRDLKPQNVMLSHDPAAGDWAVVFDFGLAKPVDTNSDLFNTAETIWSGTPMYMAPERFREPERNDPRSDIYAIGCIAYFLISGHPPFSECDPESMFALILNEHPIRMSTHRGEDVPDSLMGFVRKCMAKSLDERYQSIQELSSAIDKMRVFHGWTGEDADTWWQIHGNEWKQESAGES